MTHMAQYGKPEVATAYTKRSCDNLVQMAQVLGKEDDAAYYAQCSRHIQAAYEAYLVAEDGTIQPGHQAAYVRALALDMVTDAKGRRCRQAAGRNRKGRLPPEYRFSQHSVPAAHTL